MKKNAYAHYNNSGYGGCLWLAIIGFILLLYSLTSCGSKGQKPHYRETKTLALYVTDSGEIKYGTIYRVDQVLISPDTNNVERNKVSKSTTYWIPVNDSIWKSRSADSIYQWGIDLDSAVKKIAADHNLKPKK